MPRPRGQRAPAHTSPAGTKWLALPAAQPSGFVRACDLAEVGDEVIFYGDHGNLVRGLVAERGASPLTHCNVYRVVDLASEMFEPDTGKWVPNDSSSISARVTTNDRELVHNSAVTHWVSYSCRDRQGSTLASPSGPFCKASFIVETYHSLSLGRLRRITEIGAPPRVLFE